MEYRDFRKLIREGERDYIDFKIRCDAFKDSSTASRGELAKDICAMANNGYRASYIVVGVSDDGLSFRSVDNEKLTDDNLQDFCKKAIFPPPKVKAHRENWKRAVSPHRGKEFVIIQVGPNRRQAFRLAQDFIHYGERVCYRRNEVWIRRNATSDLATPEEIARLVGGKAPQPDAAAIEKQTARDAFFRLSLGEQRALISDKTRGILQDLGYLELPKDDWLVEPSYYGGQYFYPTYGKAVQSTVILVCTPSCRVTLSLKDLRNMSQPFDLGALIAPYSAYFVVQSALPGTIPIGARGKVSTVRRISLIPVMRSVPASRIAQGIPGSRRVSSFLHYYRPKLLAPPLYDDRVGRLVPSSSELLIVDKIKSSQEYGEALTRALGETERQTITLISPEE